MGLFRFPVTLLRSLSPILPLSIKCCVHCPPACLSVSPQTAAFTASWPVCSARCCPCARPWGSVWRAEWAEPPAATPPPAAAAAWRRQGRRPARRRRVRRCWIVGYWRTAAAPPTAWRSVWSAAPSASPRRAANHRRATRRLHMLKDRCCLFFF